MPFIITIMLKNGMMHGSVLLMLRSPSAGACAELPCQAVTSLHLLNALQAESRKQGAHSASPLPARHRCHEGLNTTTSGHFTEGQQPSPPHPVPHGLQEQQLREPPVLLCSSPSKWNEIKSDFRIKTVCNGCLLPPRISSFLRVTAN